MAASRVTLTVKDGEHFQRTFNVDPETTIQVIHDRFVQYICKKCSMSTELLNFTYEGRLASSHKYGPSVHEYLLTVTQIARNRTVKSVGLRDGDIVHVNPAVIYHDVCGPGSVYRLLNVHYLSQPIIKDVYNYRIPQRVRINLKDTSGFEMSITTKDNMLLGVVMEAFAKLAGRDQRTMRFICDEIKMDADQTLYELVVKDGDTINVSYVPLSTA